MHARAVDDASARLRELRHEEWEDFAVAAVALGVALAATQLLPSLAIPLFVGGVAIGARGVLALWRHWDLVDRLAGERDAYAISEVLAYASREATLERRRCFASSIRSRLKQPGVASERPVDSEEIEALCTELEDPDLALDPVCAVACLRLLNELAESPLQNLAVPPESVRSRVRQIRSGFKPRQLST